MTIKKLFSKKRISRELFKVCRLHRFESQAQIETYFLENGSFERLKWCGPEEKKELEDLIAAKVLDLALQFKIPLELLKSGSLVKVADFLLRKELLPKKQLELLIASSRIYENSLPRLTFDLASEMQSTEHSIQSLRTRTIGRMMVKLRSLQPIKEDLQLRYGLDLGADLLYINETHARQINTMENTAFSPQFLGLLFGVYLEADYITLGSPKQVLGGIILGNRHYWNHFYLVRKEVAAALDLEAFLQESYRMSSNGEISSLDFKTFVSHFIIRSSHIDPDVLFPVAAEIVYRELGLCINKEGKLLFSGEENPLSGYCTKALEELGEPATLAEIRRKIGDAFPGVYVDPAGFVNVLSAEKGFTRYRNLYGLRKWYPAEGGRLELQDKAFLEELTQRYPVRSLNYWASHWNEKFEDLQRFMESNSRLPRKGGEREERNLRHFYDKQLSRLRKGQLNTDEKANLKELQGRFPHNKYSHYKVDWDKRFAEVQAFAEQNGVPPNMENGDREKTLAGWLGSQRFRLKKGRLDKRQQRLLAEFDALYHQKSPAHFTRHWNKRFKDLENFAEKNSRLPKEIIKHEKSLNRWFAAQRLLMSKGGLDRRQYRLLKDFMEQYPIQDEQYMKACWHQKCDELQQFCEAKCRLPKSTIKEELPLYKWLQVQRMRGGNGRLDSQQEARLQELGDRFTVKGHHEKQWDKRFAELSHFLEQQSRLPKKYATQENSVYMWYTNQLKRAELGKLNARQQELLNQVYAPYNKVKVEWNDRYLQVRTFAEKRLRLPKRTGYTKEERFLSRWLVSQKARMKKGTLELRKQRLLKELFWKHGNERHRLKAS